MPRTKKYTAEELKLRIKESRKKNYQKNKAYKKEYYKKYYQKNKEMLDERAKKWMRTHKEEFNLYQKLYHRKTSPTYYKNLAKKILNRIDFGVIDEDIKNYIKIPNNI